jgi:hypothetical protein
VHENGINKTISQLMLQRPSLFNYATLLFTQALSPQFCQPIAPPPGGGPLFTVESPLPVLGAPKPVGLDWCLQLSNVSIDLYPGHTLTLPPELDAIGFQQFALHLRACFGLACPSDLVVENLVKHELSLVGSPLIQHFEPGVTTIGKHCQDLHTALKIDDTKPQWRVFCDPQTIDFDLFDFADTVGDLFEQAFTAALDAVLPHGLLHDLILAGIGSVADLLRTLLDIPDDFSEWLSDLFNVSLGVFNLILQFVADFFGKCLSFYQLDDPFPMFPKTKEKTVELPAVTVPIQNLTAIVNDAELVVTADIGGVS